MRDQWQQLNHRQRTYLQALYECDQAKEAERRQRAARGVWDRTPAREWRWIMYGPVAPPSMLYQRLKKARIVDPGTGATWQALEDRGLVHCRTVSGAFGVQLLEIQITKLGRSLVRTTTGEQRQKAPPKGQLKERQWAALVRLYAAGAAGESAEDMMYSRGGFNWHPTLIRLRDYKPEPLMEEYSPQPGDYRMRITAYGCAYFEQERERYRELYPAVALLDQTNA